MIVFDLRCAGGDLFEGWFRSGEDFDRQRERGLVECPVCGSSSIGKAPMAPRLPRRGGAEPAEAMREIAALQAKLLTGSTWVGDGFTEQARAMHHGETEPRPVHGNATVEEARSLADEGVPVLPLPLPVVPPGRVN